MKHLHLTIGSLLALGACGAPPQQSEESDAIGLTQLAIEDAPDSLDFPGVGRYKGPNGGGCGATLIDSWHFITAAHCLPEPTVLGGVFYVQTGHRQNQGFGVHETVRLRMDEGQGNEILDLAIGRLKRSPVVDGYAQPIDFATIEPSPGDFITFLGFGGRDADCEGAGGWKQRFDFIYDPNNLPQESCGGDSGGAYLNAAGDLVWVHSGTRRDTDEQVWAHPLLPTAQGRINKVLRAMNDDSLCFWWHESNTDQLLDQGWNLGCNGMTSAVSHVDRLMLFMPGPNNVCYLTEANDGLWYSCDHLGQAPHGNLGSHLTEHIFQPQNYHSTHDFVIGYGNFSGTGWLRAEQNGNVFTIDSPSGTAHLKNVFLFAADN